MHHATAWLSVLIPAYNVQEYLAECLESILVQARHGVEIIVVNDGSGDATGAVAAAFQHRYAGIVTIHNHTVNQGISLTRNRLLEMAHGEYLWFVDADDTMKPGAIASLENIVARHAPDLVLCDYSRRRGRRERRCRSFSGPSRQVIRDTSALVAGMFAGGQLHPWSKISKRSLWSADLQFPAGRVFEDVTVMPRLAIRAATAFHEPEPWIEYRQWPGSILATMNPRKCVDLTRGLADFPADLRARGVCLSKQAIFALRHYAARHFVGAMRHLSRWDDPETAQQARRECRRFFLQTIEEQLDWLNGQYLRRGWLLRWAKLKHWMQVAADYETPRGFLSHRAPHPEPTSVLRPPCTPGVLAPPLRGG